MNFKYLRATKVDWINKSGVHSIDEVTQEDVDRAIKGENVIKYFGDTVIVVYQENDTVYIKEFNHARVWENVKSGRNIKHRANSADTGIVLAYKRTDEYKDFVKQIL